MSIAKGNESIVKFVTIRVKYIIFYTIILPLAKDIVSKFIHVANNVNKI